MKAFYTSPVWKHVGLIILLVLTTGLLTLLFNLLGAISCAALVGMMMGSTRRWQWVAVPVSLVFPGVVGVFFELGKAEVTGRQSLLLSILCFGGFWLAYLLTLGLVYYESRGEGVPADETAEPAAAPEPALEPELQELQGIWVRETVDFGGHLCRRILKVERGLAAWSMVDCHGLTRVLSKGELAFETFGAYKMVRVLGLCPFAPVDGSEAAALYRTWIYRVNGSTLAIAFNFDEADPKRAPVLETYVKVPGAI